MNVCAVYVILRWLVYVSVSWNVKCNLEGTSTVQIKEVSSSSMSKLAVICLGFIQM
jgi:hypothetical protein